MYHQNIPLRTCRHCGLQAFTTEDLELFKTRTVMKHGKDNYCKSCWGLHHNKGGKYYDKRQEAKKRWNKQGDEPQKNRVRIMSRYYNPVIESCTKCPSTENLQRHHEEYTDPNKFIVLCESCHKEVHNE